ncbi:MAG: hypothetical protein Q9217_002778 [Psora testacea]
MSMPIMKSSMLALSHILLWSTALASPTPSLSPRDDCGTVISPSNFWQIHEQEPYRDEVNILGPFPPNNELSFHVSQDANGANEKDLIASFKNVPCPPAGRGPYAVEFLYVLDDRYYYSGNVKIDMFAINGPLPTETTGGTTEQVPTWNNMAGLTGSLVGTFSLPVAPDAIHSKLVNINSFTCQPEMNFRFSINNDSPAAGEVGYFQANQAGLRIRYGC